MRYVFPLVYLFLLCLTELVVGRALCWAQDAIFITYPSSDTLVWGDQGNGTFRNPVLWADYDNPDVIRVGDDFYMVVASHHFMGNFILHSQDMVNWKIINRLWRGLEIDPVYDQPGQTYQKGSWASEGRLYCD